MPRKNRNYTPARNELSSRNKRVFQKEKKIMLSSNHFIQKTSKKQK